jgi:SAM-dependent methyltransferase
MTLAVLLNCPVCREDMGDIAFCANCGEQYGAEQGTPRLISSRSRAEVKYTFWAKDSTVGPDFYAALAYPPRAPRSANSPYHLDAAHQLVLERSTGTVLEIGCGGGQMRQWSESHGLAYIGTDISKTRVNDELQKHGGPDILCDAHFLPFRAEIFDIVYSAAVTEHIADPHLMMSEVLRVLRPGGIYLGNSSFLEPWHDDSYFHMSPLGAYRALRSTGFDVENVWPGLNYSGYLAMLQMGNRLTQFLVPLGKFQALVYRSGLTLRYLLRRPGPRGGKIAWDACVAGAVDWIAQKPPCVPEVMDAQYSVSTEPDD